MKTRMENDAIMRRLIAFSVGSLVMMSYFKGKTIIMVILVLTFVTSVFKIIKHYRENYR